MRWSLCLAAVLLATASLRGAALEVRPAAVPEVEASAGGGGRIDVRARGASLFALGKSLEMRLQRSVTFDLQEDRAVDFLAEGLTPLACLRKLAREQELDIVELEGGFLLQDATEPRMSLDVKDAPVGEILKSIKEQCGIRNMMVDRDVSGSGTFLLTDVPCRTATRIIFQTLGLQGVTYRNSVLRVSR